MKRFEIATEHTSGSYSSGVSIHRHKVEADSFQVHNEWVTFYREQDEEHENMVFKVRTSKVLYIRCGPEKS